jgi:HSP20 family protein
MRYNTIHAKDFGKLVNPVLKTIAHEVQKEMANHKDFPFTNPLTNIVSLENSIEIHLAVPGLSKEDIAITLDKNQLTVTSQKNVEDATYRQREFKFGTFKKVFNLPDTVNKEKITAATENGILKITLEKLPEALKKTITVL